MAISVIILTIITKNQQISDIIFENAKPSAAEAMEGEEWALHTEARRKIVRNADGNAKPSAAEAMEGEGGRCTPKPDGKFSEMRMVMRSPPPLKLWRAKVGVAHRSPTENSQKCGW